MPVPVEALRSALGADFVLTDDASMTAYSTDATPLQRARPEAVALAGSRDDVQAVMRLAAEHRFPVTPRASGTSLTAGAVPLQGGIVLSCARMNALLEVDEENLTAACQPGFQNAQLQEAVAARGLFYPPDPGSLSICDARRQRRGERRRPARRSSTASRATTCSAWRSCSRAARCCALGGKRPRAWPATTSSRLLVGSEGTLGVITEITLKLLPRRPRRRDRRRALRRSRGLGPRGLPIIAAGILPRTLEFLDAATMRVVDEAYGLGLPEAGAMLIFGQDGAPPVVERDVALMAEACRAEGGFGVEIAATPDDAARLLQARRGAIPAIARLAPTLILEDADRAALGAPGHGRASQRIAAEGAC